VPVEGLGTTGNFKLRLVIARTGRGSHLASKVMWYEDNPFLEVTADFLDPNAPSIFGHAGAKAAITAGAYSYDNGLLSTQFTPELESFSSVGPFLACCDIAGNRLDSLEVRQKPEICGVDRVSTTFFNPDPTGSVSSFPGTSAAAPHVAGVAALLLEAAGGPKSLTPDQVRSKLIASTGQHDLDPNFSQAVLDNGSVSVKVKAQGSEDFTNLSNTKFFTIEYSSSNAGQTLASLSIDLGPTGLHFNTNSRSLSGFAFKTAQLPDGAQVTSTVSGSASTILTLTFTGLQPGATVQFGIGREQRSTRSDGLSADLLAGATLTATLEGPAGTLNGSFVNQLGTGYMPVDGFGLIDALKAVRAQ
jgi:subtilisin family serine protease